MSQRPAALHSGFIRAGPPARFVCDHLRMKTVSSAMPTPCIGVCTLDPAGYCDGCLRTGAEIAGWIGMGESARAYLMETVLPEREARRAAGGALR